MAIRFTEELFIQASPERVLRAMTEVEEVRTWMPNLVHFERLDQGEYGVGARWRETRKMFGMQATEEFEVTGYDPPRSLELYVDGTKGSSKKGEYRFRYTFEIQGGATLLRLDGEIGGMGRVGEIIGRLFSGMYKKAIRKDHLALKAHVESSSPAEA